MAMHPLRRRALTGAAALVVVGGVVTAGVVAARPPEGKHLTAVFDHATGVYPGSDLRVLGVKVGTVDSVRPEGTKVLVTLTLDAGVRVPAEAQAVVVAPSVVADRYIQLTPAWTGGPEIADHTEIPLSRTANPLELDQLYQSVTQLADALGPNGANATGALSRLLDTGAQNLGGNGKAIGDSIAGLGQAGRTLSGHSGDLFATLDYLQSFTAMLKENDGKVRTATDQLASVTGFLAQDRQDIGAALQQLATALGQVKGFIQDNRDRLKTVVERLAPITQSLVDQRTSLAELLDTAPLAADNVLNAFDTTNGTLDGRVDLNELGGAPMPLPLPLPPTGTIGSGGTR
ncbi:ABC transporter substrate-binding protein [Kitasatospora sp. MMS16-BH015]|uniref:MCE family protein n=1 Tax=Kitasatospora sp. MMS16-BH015 TaxID=2018025 RepID=UPI000CA29D7D|nr:MCE family protein [Kitasatospora sp. MMS16-BH015]AUG81164.1 ABC transporter substrate-binding protein [Kitasatospora sp. MMS16-BH015]